MQGITPKEADAYDRLLDAAENLADLIGGCGVEMDEYALEELSVFLANNAGYIRGVLKNLKT